MLKIRLPSGSSIVLTVVVAWHPWDRKALQSVRRPLINLTHSFKSPTSKEAEGEKGETKGMRDDR